MKAFTMRLDSSEYFAQWDRRQPQVQRTSQTRPHKQHKLPSRGLKAPTAKHQSRSGAETNHGVEKLPQIRDGTTTKPLVMKRMKDSNKGTRTTRRASNIWGNDEKNREEQSQWQAREEHNQQQTQRTKGMRPRQGEARGDARCKAKRSRPSQGSTSTWKSWSART